MDSYYGVIVFEEISLNWLSAPMGGQISKVSVYVH